MIHLIAPMKGKILSGGYLYNERVAAELPSENFAYHGLERVDELVDIEKWLPLSDEDLILLDSLFFSRPELLDELRGKWSGRIWMLIHCLPSLNPSLSLQEQADWKLREERAISCCDGLVVTGTVSGRVIRERSLYSGTILTAIPGIDRKSFYEAFVPRFPAEPGESRGERVELLTVANWTPLKNHQALIPVLAGLQDLPWRWRIVGAVNSNTPLYEEFWRRAEEEGIAGRIESLGALPPEETAARMREADIYLFPSLMESYGMSVAEAMSCGCAVVAGANEGTSELVRNGEDALLLDPADSELWRKELRILMENFERRTNLSLAARERAAAFPSWRDTARSLYDGMTGAF